MTAVDTDTSCPKCGGRMWDNRATKTNPKAPDFKCRDRTCDGVIWPPKNGAAPARVAAKPTAKVPTALGGPMPWEEQETGAPPAGGGSMVELTALYSRCLNTAIALSAQTDALAGPEGVSPVIVASVTATLFIEANKRGIK